MNTFTASFDTTVRQMIEMSQLKKSRMSTSEDSEKLASSMRKM